MKILSFGSLNLDKVYSVDHFVRAGETLSSAKLEAFCGGKEIKLAQKDFNLLMLLMQNKGAVLSRDVILSKIWGWDFDGDNRTVDTHIKIIRKALGDKAHLIVTTTGIGYSFKKEE